MRDGVAVAVTLPLMWVSCGAFDELLARHFISPLRCDSEGNQQRIFNQPGKKEDVELYRTELDTCQCSPHI